MKKYISIIVLLAAVYMGLGQFETLTDSTKLTGSSDQALALAFEQKKSGVQTKGIGIVTRILADDREGSRHQRFILRLDSGQTLLIAHNIDLAPRISSISVGDSVEFNGEYEWTSRGGVIHWTHHDPNGRHVAGWLRHQGRLYQ